MLTHNQNYHGYNRPIVQREKSRKQLAEERRNNAFIAVVDNIKKELILRGFGNGEVLTSQPAVLMLVAETLNQVDLKAKFPEQPRRKSEGGKMTRETEKVVKATREQMRRNKKNAAIDSLREFINRKKLVYGSTGRLEQLEVVRIILEHIRTLPVSNIVTPTSVQQPFGQISPPITTIPTSSSLPRRPTGAFNIDSLLGRIAPTTSPQSPSLPTLIPTPPIGQQDPVSSPVGSPSPILPDVFSTGALLPPVPQFNFPWTGTPFPMLDPIALEIQHQIQIECQRMLQNRASIQKAAEEIQIKEEDLSRAGSSRPSEVPIERENSSDLLI
ncbi:hypothetical protein GCK72_010931 [Caenorhabditis remanei]|uniref:BHLH domain-containing protein n=1 Tax=Caenorhabditis remanei TaxID=31234 RepID=A0A6A5H6H5_CAERE|nr:hypothetical protein GCK72_010931 [Caenorhabditis remanei]KAF1762669.1 hypothetical protein GCK72_010931 [Caenorhabditis remanei]